MTKAQSNIRLYAFAASAVVHISLIVYALQNYSPIQIPKQQMIQISLIAVSLPEKLLSEPVKQVIKKPIIEKKGMAINKVKEAPTTEAIPELAQLEPESGEQKATPEPTQDAVITKPMYNADYLRNPPPKYPEAAKRRRQQGSVLLKVLVSQNGKAEHVIIHSSSGSDILDDAAKNAVSNWKFIPAKRNNEFVTASVIVPIDFKLE